MKTASLVASVALVGLLASSATGQDARATRLYDQIGQFGLSSSVAEWLAEEAARARVRNISVGNTGGNYGVSDSNGLIKIQDSAGGRSIRNLTHEIAHIGSKLSGHDCRWIRYLTGMALRFEERFGRGEKWGTHSLESYYARYNLEHCRP